jgi:hypothetical protein
VRHKSDDARHIDDASLLCFARWERQGFKSALAALTLLIDDDLS